MANDLNNIRENLRALKKSMADKHFQEDKMSLVSAVSRDVSQTLKPFLQSLIATINTKKSETVLKSPDVHVSVPDIQIPDINVPKPEVTVNIPPFPKIPDFPKFPQEMGVKGWIGFMGYDKGLLNDPLPVQIRDAFGNPVNLGSSSQIMGGGGGGKADFLTIKGFGASAYADYINSDNRLRVSVETGGSAITDAELRASSVPVEQVSGSVWSTYVSGAFGSSTVDSVWNADNRLRVSVETGGSGLTDAELRASSVPVEQVSGSTWSTEASQAGTWNIATLTGITNSVAANIVDSTGVAYSGSNPVPVTGSVTATGGGYLTDAELRASGVEVHQVSGASWSTEATQSGTWNIATLTGITNSVAASITDSSGVQYSGSNPVPVLSRPIRVRGSLQTAYVTENEVGEVTLLAGASSTYHDLVYIMGANESDAAINLDIRQTTGGTVQMSIELPANGTAGVSVPVPIPQDHAGASWTVQNSASDNSNTNYSVTALFSKES